MLGQKSTLIGILKEETDVSLIVLFHYMIQIENICAQFSKANYEKCHELSCLN